MKFNCLKCKEPFTSNRRSAKYCGRLCFDSVRSVRSVSCEYCGTSFHPADNGTRRYCSKACYGKSNRRQPLKVVCERCGCSFSGAPSRKYCSHACYAAGDPKVDGPLTAERLRSLLSYDAASGLFRWSVARRARGGRVQIGDVAGFVDNEGYVNIRIDGVLYQAHRLAWLHVYGDWPSWMLDHRDLNKHHNSLANLRIATPTQNNMNMPLRMANTSGAKGVAWDRGKWAARIGANGVSVYLGRFDCYEDAVAARLAAAEKLHGQFLRER